MLPSGKDYCGEDAATDKAQDACIGDLEDTLLKANRAIVRLANNAYQFIAGEKLRRDPCTRWEKFWRYDRCAKNSATP